MDKQPTEPVEPQCLDELRAAMDALKKAIRAEIAPINVALEALYPKINEQARLYVEIVEKMRRILDPYVQEMQKNAELLDSIENYLMALERQGRK